MGMQKVHGTSSAGRAGIPAPFPPVVIVADRQGAAPARRLARNGLRGPPSPAEVARSSCARGIAKPGPRTSATAKGYGMPCIVAVQPLPQRHGRGKVELPVAPRSRSRPERSTRSTHTHRRRRPALRQGRQALAYLAAARSVKSGPTAPQRTFTLTYADDAPIEDKIEAHRHEGSNGRRRRRVPCPTRRAKAQALQTSSTATCRSALGEDAPVDLARFRPDRAAPNRHFHRADPRTCRPTRAPAFVTALLRDESCRCRALGKTPAGPEQSTSTEQGRTVGLLFLRGGRFSSSFRAAGFHFARGDAKKRGDT